MGEKEGQKDNKYLCLWIALGTTIPIVILSVVGVMDPEGVIKNLTYSEYFVTR